MKLGSALFILTSLVGIVVITKHSAATAGYEKILELGREHRREELQNPVVTGTIGWRRRRSIKGKRHLLLCGQKSESLFFLDRSQIESCEPKLYFS